MLRRFFLMFSILALGSCAHALDDADQEVTLLTPGAVNALCFMWVDGVKYKTRPPHTITVIRSKEDMKVDCRAPGNRQRTVVIRPKIARNTYWNVSNLLIPGVTWDYLSGAAFEYPEVVEVDFRNMAPREQPLPDQNAPDIKQPEEYPLEEFLPGRPRLTSDKFNTSTGLQRRERGGSGAEEEIIFEDSGDLSPVPMKGDLEAVIETIGEDVNPASAPATVIAPAEEASETPLFPVE